MPQYMDIFSKHTTDIANTDLVQMTLKLKTNIKALDQKPYKLILKYHILFRYELMDMENTCSINPSTSNFTLPVIIVSKKKDPFPVKITYWFVADFRKIIEQLEYWSYH